MKIVALQNTVLKKQRIDSTLLSAKDKLSFNRNETLECFSVKEGGQNHWTIKLKNNSNWYFAYKPHCVVNWDNLITYHHFRGCFRYANKSDINTYFEPFNKTLQEYKISTVQRIAAFIAQIALDILPDLKVRGFQRLTTLVSVS